MSPEPKIPRKYPRVRAPKGMWVGWKSAKQTCTSLAEVMGLGGLFLHTANPPPAGSSIELIFDLPTGQVRARAIVRSLQSNKGMGIQFVQMRPEDRAKLNKYLSLQELSPIVDEIITRAASAKPTNAHSVHSARSISSFRSEAKKPPSAASNAISASSSNSLAKELTINCWGSLPNLPSARLEELPRARPQIPSRRPHGQSLVGRAGQRAHGHHHRSLQNS